MKLVFLVIAILINFFNHSLIKSEEKIDSVNKKIENITKKKSINEDKSKVRKIHIVKMGDTISSISKIYSINKDLIIKLNKLKNENYIYVCQYLVISESTENSPKQLGLINNYHIVKMGETLTEISNKYNLNLENLIEINNLKNPDSIKVGQSGTGKFHGEEGFRNFSNQKSITFKGFLFDLNLRYPPYARVKRFLKLIFKI